MASMATFSSFSPESPVAPTAPTIMLVSRSRISTPPKAGMNLPPDAAASESTKCGRFLVIVFSTKCVEWPSAMQVQALPKAISNRNVLLLSSRCADTMWPPRSTTRKVSGRCFSRRAIFIAVSMILLAVAKSISLTVPSRLPYQLARLPRCRSGVCFRFRTAPRVRRGNLLGFGDEPLGRHFEDDVVDVAVLLVIQPAGPHVFAPGGLDRGARLLVVLDLEAHLVQSLVVLAEVLTAIFVGLELDDGDVDHAIGTVHAGSTHVIRIDLADFPHPEGLDVEVGRLPRVFARDAQMPQFACHGRLLG